MKRSGGFTIIETMLYLAVSTALMVSTILIISNQQKGTEFHQAVKDLENQFQDQFNDVSTGYFQRKDSTSCSLGSGTVNIQDTGGGVGAGCVDVREVRNI
jgi:type II secretory pathway pseudopilin PulG